MSPSIGAMKLKKSLSPCVDRAEIEPVPLSGLDGSELIGMTVSRKAPATFEWSSVTVSGVVLMTSGTNRSRHASRPGSGRRRRALTSAASALLL